MHSGAHLALRKCMQVHAGRSANSSISPSHTSICSHSWTHSTNHSHVRTYPLLLWVIDLTNAVCRHMRWGMCVDDMRFVFVLKDFVNKSSINTAIWWSVHRELQQKSHGEGRAGCFCSSRNTALSPERHKSFTKSVSFNVKCNIWRFLYLCIRLW